MKLKDLLQVLTQMHLTIWQRNAQGTFVVVAKGSTNRRQLFDDYLDHTVVKVSATNYKDLSITIESE